MDKYALNNRIRNKDFENRNLTTLEKGLKFKNWADFYAKKRIALYFIE